MSTLRRLEALGDGEREGLVDLLIDSVDGGASVGFMAPLSRERAGAYWREVAASLGPGRLLWVAEEAGRVVGAVQLAPCLRENSLHRADLQKLFVHSSARGQGLASRLLREVEHHARGQGLTLLVLDTLAGTKAEAVYLHHGWHRVGAIPGYALDPFGALCPTVVFYKTLAP
jgi:acetyltransferase